MILHDQLGNTICVDDKTGSQLLASGKYSKACKPGEEVTARKTKK